MQSARCSTGGFVLVLTLALATPVRAQPWVQAETADSLQRAGKLAEAAAIYQELTAENPFNGYAWSQLGYCLHGEKQYERALAAYARAIDLGHGRPFNLYNGACAH